MNLGDVKPEDIESSYDLANDPERRIKFQADIQDYVDMGISSTINLPKNAYQILIMGVLLTSLRSMHQDCVGLQCTPDEPEEDNPHRSNV